MKLALCMGFIWPAKPCSLSFDSFNEAKMMTASRRVIKFTIGKADLSELESIARSRTEPVGRVERARVLLAYRQDPSFYAVGAAYRRPVVAPTSTARVVTPYRQSAGNRLREVLLGT